MRVRQEKSGGGAVHVAGVELAFWIISATEQSLAVSLGPTSMECQVAWPPESMCSHHQENNLHA